MPRSFTRCVKRGGRVRTLKGGRKICFPKGGGKAKVGHKPRSRKRKR